MKFFVPAVWFLWCGALLAVAASEPQPFTRTLTSEQKTRLGLTTLTPAQLAELDAAVAAYHQGAQSAAVQEAVAVATQQTEQKAQQAVQEAARQAEQKVQEAEKKAQEAEKKAAETAVADYKKKQEPGVIARTLEVFKRKQAEDAVERFTGKIVGEFRGWSGGTYFPLQSGQVWRQVGSDVYELPPAHDAEVEIFKSKNGYYRLKVPDGSWVTVKRLQ